MPAPMITTSTSVMAYPFRRIDLPPFVAGYHNIGPWKIRQCANDRNDFHFHPGMPTECIENWRAMKNGRSGGIRTHDPFTPSKVRYQAALRSDLDVIRPL